MLNKDTFENIPEELFIPMIASCDLKRARVRALFSHVCLVLFLNPANYRFFKRTKR